MNGTTATGRGQFRQGWSTPCGCARMPPADVCRTRERSSAVANREPHTMTTAVIGATGRVGSEIVRGPLARGASVTALVRDPGKAHAPSASPVDCTSDAPAWTTRAISPRHLAGSGLCSSRWDQSGSKASCNAWRSTPPRGARRSSKSRACRELGCRLGAVRR
jgi:hypothetical protein